MIHEIILSLIGQTGDIIILVDKRRNKRANENNINIDEYCFEVNNNIHIFLSSEIKIINEIVEIGYYFYILNIFCLLVKNNTVYKSLTHIHKFNKLNSNKKKNIIKEKNNDKTNHVGDCNENSSTEAASSLSPSDKSSTITEESEDTDNLSNSYKKRKYEKNDEIDNYFGVILKNIKSINNVRPYGYYANGISNEINKFIKRYLKKISEIEEYINNNKNTPLTQILSMLEKKKEEIIIIINIIKKFLEFQRKEEANILEGESRNKTKEILDYLYECCLCGNSRIKNVYHKYFKNLGKILLHQISSWILYGQLLDPYYEFFIQKRQFIYSDDKKIFLTPEELYENLTLTNVQSLNFEWNYLFFQSVSNLPECCIDKILGRKILFIGKSIRILIRSNKWNTNDILKLFPITKILSKAFDQTLHTNYPKKNNYLGKDFMRYEHNIDSNEYENNNITHNMNYGFDQNDISNTYNDNNYNYNNMPKGYASSISLSCTSSSDNSYECSSESGNEATCLYCKEIFDITIEKIRSIIAYKLWEYVVKDINLIKIFDLFKDIYLLNNGDFYDYFLEKSWFIMHSPPNYKNELLLKIIAWKNSTLSVEDYCKSKYENKKDKLILEKYENLLFSRNNNIDGGDSNNPSSFFNSSNFYNFDVDISENIISKYFYPRISYKKFSYDSFEREKYGNLILGGMSYIYDNKIVLNDFYKGIQELYKKKYYDYDSIYSVCINNYRQQILKGFKHGFDFSVNFNNFFDNKFINIDNVEGIDGNPINSSKISNDDNFLVGCCFSLVIQSVKNPLLYKTDILNGDSGYWGSLGDCLAVEIKVKFYEDNKNKTIKSVGDINNPVLGYIEVEVSLYIGGKGISSFVHDSNSYTVDYTKESILNNKILANNINLKKKNKSTYEDIQHGEENYMKNQDADKFKDDEDNFNIEDMDDNNNYKSKFHVLKIQTNKQIFHNIDKNSLTKFRVRINCIKHSFSVYIQKLDEYNLQVNNPKNKIKPIIHIRALDMTQAFTLDIGNGYIGFYTCPILFKHKLLKKKSKIKQWLKRFYNNTLNADSPVNNYGNTNNGNDNNLFNIYNDKNTETITNEIKKINQMILYNNNNDAKHDKNNLEEIELCRPSLNTKMNKSQKKKKDNSKDLFLFSCYDCSVEIYKWFHQSYKSPIEIPEIDVDNETLIFYDKNINKNIKIHSGLNLWNNIEIHFKLTWPIALIINTNTIYTYNSIFQFLFLLGRIYYNLKILCYHNRRLYKYLNYKKGFLLFSYLFSIRYKMQFFIFHLIRYLQEDIINYEYKLMSTQIHKSKDFEYTKSIHDLYISQVATKCFLRVQDLTTPLMELIDVSFKFCYFFQCLIENELFTDILNYEMDTEMNKQKDDTKNGKNSDENGDDDKDNDLKQVVEKLLQYNDTFNQKLVRVINEMMNLSSNSNHSHLVHLLTILDFNNCITKIKESIEEKTEMNKIANTNENKNDDREIQNGINNNKPTKRDDMKIGYTDVENTNNIDNYYLNKHQPYNNNILKSMNLSINNMPQNYDEKWNIQKNEISSYSQNNILKQGEKSALIEKNNTQIETQIGNKYHYDYYKGEGVAPHSNSMTKNYIPGDAQSSQYDTLHGGTSYNDRNYKDTRINSYNALIDKYSNILSSYINKDNNDNLSKNNDENPSIYNSSKNYGNNNLNIYNSNVNLSQDNIDNNLGYNLAPHGDTNIKNNFNVQKLIDTYNYNYDRSHNIDDFDRNNLDHHK
ncbi:hypothetical protein YYG_03367 [Plasmodium vinckei petteri]|uniref:Gamma-tubulin complex component, putative n=1 Tax=Plasmodium vinckei petteri TaxID=138298 RepID=W7AHV6_PLAVN|nr:hypothetical protein YYG_03367 [Plasmodium vinckei petteri]CAD2111215.1 gamma-tubulin complex component, putative [Plasmodium vinckei petteri]